MRPRQILAALALALVVACAAAGPAAGAHASTVVLPGSYPDPTVVRFGGEYVATATSDRWRPVFPVLTSPDLQTFTQRGWIFGSAPAWATGGRFWAPDLSVVDGRLVVVYSGLKRNGQWCVGAASTDRPAGPWTDHGPVFCPPRGAIDPTLVDDGAGGWALAYKGKGIGGRIWIVTFDPHAMAVTGTPQAIMRPRDGDHGVTEGPALMHRDGWWYLFFATGNCCHPPCTYRERIARARELYGPYQRAKGALLRSGGGLSCPGHGSLVEGPGGTLEMLHHAYDVSGGMPRVREGVLTPLRFQDGWPEIADDGLLGVPAGAAGGGYTSARPARHGGTTVADDFRAGVGAWQWTTPRRPRLSAGDGTLRLGCGAAGLIARQVTGRHWQAAITVAGRGGRGAAVTLAALDQGGMLRGIELRGGKVRTLRRSARRVVDAGAWRRAPAGGPVRLRLSVRPGVRVAGFVRGPGGWERLPATTRGSAASVPSRLALACTAGRGVASFRGLHVSGAQAVPVAG